MPLYMDWHDFPEGVSAEDVALAHVRDLQIQDRFGCRYLSYWFDYDRRSGFCLVDAPSKVEPAAVHREAHGLMASRIIEVDPRKIDEFLGAMPEGRPAQPYVETAFRAILFTDLEGSTALTQQLGDARAMRLLGFGCRARPGTGPSLCLRQPQETDASRIRSAHPRLRG